MKISLAIALLLFSIAHSNCLASELDAGRAIFATGGDGMARTIGGEVLAARFPCRSCHGPFGGGGGEGATRAPAIGWDALARASPARPAYDAGSVRGAIVDGRGAAGAELDPAMPRYALGPEQLTALADYLAALPAIDRTGVDDGSVAFGVLATPTSRAAAKRYAERLARRFDEAGAVYGRRARVRLVEAADAASETAVRSGLSSAPTVAVVGLAPVDAAALAAVTGAGDTPVLFPFSPLTPRVDRALTRSVAPDQGALIEAIVARIAKDGARRVVIVTDKPDTEPLLRVATEIAEEKHLETSTPAAEARDGDAVLLLAPFDASIGPLLERINARRSARVYGFAGDLSRHLARLEAAGTPYTLAVENAAIVRRAVETGSSIIDAHADVAAALIVGALATAGPRLGRSSLLAAIRKQRSQISSQDSFEGDRSAGANERVDFIAWEPR